MTEEDKDSPFISLKDAAILLSIGGTAIWLLLHKDWKKEGNEAEVKPEEKEHN